MEIYWLVETSIYKKIIVPASIDLKNTVRSLLDIFFDFKSCYPTFDTARGFNNTSKRLCSTVHVLPEEHSYNGQERLWYIGPVLDVKTTGNQVS